MEYCFGVDIGGTTVKMGLFSAEGELIHKWEIKTQTQNEGERILPDVAESILREMDERDITAGQVSGVGVGIPAPVNSEGIVQNTANLGWGYKDVKGELSKLLSGLEVRAGNDANVAALGEMWMGGGQGRKNVVMVTLGTGVGGGIIHNGRIVVGENGAGGEIGHICVNYEEKEKCGCGKTGCLEQYASATGIARLARRRLAKYHEQTILNREDISAKTVFDAVKKKDEVAIKIAEEFGVYLGHALANIAVIFDPAVIVIGGGVSRAGEVLLPFIEKPFRERAFFANQNTEFALAMLGNDAGIYGAAKLVLDE